MRQSAIYSSYVIKQYNYFDMMSNIIITILIFLFIFVINRHNYFTHEEHTFARNKCKD